MMTKWNTKTAKNAPADAQSDAREPYALGEWRQTLELKRPKENRYTHGTATYAYIGVVSRVNGAAYMAVP